MSNILWYSWESLNKIRLFSKRYAQVVLVPTSVSWVAKRLSYYLKIPILAADPTVTETISSRSQMKSEYPFANPHTLCKLISSM